MPYGNAHPWSGKTTILHFANMSAVALYKCELEGQISDGLYENRAPFNHWEWIGKCKPVIDTKENGYSYESGYGPDHSVRYSLRSLISHIGKKDDWDWTERILAFGKLGSILTEDQLETFWKESYELRCIIEYVYYHKDWDTVEKVRKGIPTYFMDYLNKCTLLTDELIKKYQESSYSLTDLKRDAETVSRTVNTKI